MKLYATVTSERTNKGQGGNKYLEILVKAEGLEGIPMRTNIYRLYLSNDDGVLQAELLDFSTGIVSQLTKGEKQKGAKQSY